ncbi:MAG: NADH-quinone oxidoreductase subunit C, partial [Candidatus Methylophosphatis roskildensis]
MQRFAGIERDFNRLEAPLAIWHGEVSRDDWLTAARSLGESGARLVSLWGSDWRRNRGCFAVSAAYALPGGLLWLTVATDPVAPCYPDLSAIFPSAARMQRAAYDLLGVVAEGAADTRNWLRHGAWPADYFPLRHEYSGNEQFEACAEPYPFVAVEGDGVHEIPVGPVHAG